MRGGRATIQVGGGDVDNVALTLGPGIEMRVRVFIDGQPLAQPSIRLSLVPVDGAPASPNRVSFGGGTFVFPGVPEGRYRLDAALPRGAYVHDVVVQPGQSAYDEGILVAGRTMDVDPMIQTQGAEVKGVVLDATQQAFASAQVALVPHEPRRQNPALYKTAISDHAGRFHLTGIEPGEDKLFAWRYAPPGAWMNRDFISRYEDRGQIVRLAPGTPMDARVTLIPLEIASR
jgi:hypothetical protein